MRSASIRFVLSLLILLIAPATSAGAANELDDQLAFERSLDLLKARMRLKVLATLQSRGYFIPPSLIDDVAEQIRDLSGNLDAASMQNIQTLQSWVQETDIVKEAEDESMQKLAEQFFSKVLKGLEPDIKSDGLKDDAVKAATKISIQDFLKARAEFQKKLVELEAQRLSKAVGIYNEMKLIIENTGMRPEMQKITKEAAEQFERGVVQVYRGVLTGRRDAVQRISQLNRERARLDGTLQMLKGFEHGMKILEFVSGSTPERFIQVPHEATLSYLKAKYPDEFGPNEEATVKWWGEAAKKIAKSTTETWDQFQQLQANSVLRRHPETLRLAKQFALLSGFYNNTIGVATSCEALKPAAPIFDFLDFYGKAVGLIPEFAVKMQTFTDLVDQDYKQIRASDPFNVVPSNENLIGTPLLAAFGVQVATDLPMEAENAQFFLVVDKSVSSERYVKISREEYQRLFQAVADERLAFAGASASRGFVDYMKDRLTGSRRESPVSPQAYESYLNSLRAEVRNHPFTSGQLYDLAQGRSVVHNDELCDAQKFQEKRDWELNRLAIETAIRESLHDFTEKHRGEWFDFERVLNESSVALTPEQYLALFNYYHQKGGHEAHLRGSLKRLAKIRQIRREGVAKVGIPLITVTPEITRVKAGEPATVEATILTSDLAPGREITVDGRWILPDWAGNERPCQVKLKNGSVKVRTELTVPEDIAREAFDIRLKLRIPRPLGEEEIGLLDRRGSPPSLALALAGVLELPATRPAFDEVEGRASIDVEGLPTGPVKIKVERDDASKANRIIITSDELGKLDASKPDSGVVFTIYRAQSEDGPFLEIPGAAAFGSDEILPPDDQSSGRISKNQFRALDLSRGWEDFPHQPFYYMVGMQTITLDPMSRGEEVKSGVSRIGKPIVVVDPSQALSTPHDGEWMQVSASLGLSDQRYDFPGAHFVVQRGSWKGHFWSQTPRQYKPQMWTSLNVPNPLQGGAVTIVAESGGQTATATVELPARVGPDERALAQIKDNERAIEERATDFKKRSQKLQQIIPYWEEAHKNMAEDGRLYLNGVFTLDAMSEQEPEEVKHVTGSGNMGRDEVSGQIARFKKELELYENPWGYALESIHMLRVENGRLGRDPSAMLAAARALAQQCRARVAYEERDAHSTPGSYLGSMASAYEAVMISALQVGDVGAFMEGASGHLEALARIEAAKQSTRYSIPGSVAMVAEGIACLTGDRERAAAMWLSAMPAPSAPPAWWPNENPKPLVQKIDSENVEKLNAALKSPGATDPAR